MSGYDRLFEPITVGELELPNRIVMAPLTRSRSDEEGRVPSYAADYYAQRADAGLVISEATNISPGAVGYALTPGIWSAEQVEAWRPVVDAVHARGGRFVLQLWHTGRISHPDLHGGEAPGAPSAVKPEGKAFTADGMKDMEMPRAFETDEIPAILEDYRRAAENAREAGFDGVEVHSANNYLLEQFIRDSHQPPRRRVRRLAGEPAALPAAGGARPCRRLGRRAGRHPHLAGDDDARARRRSTATPRPPTAPTSTASASSASPTPT